MGPTAYQLWTELFLWFHLSLIFLLISVCAIVLCGVVLFGYLMLWYMVKKGAYLVALAGWLSSGRSQAEFDHTLDEAREDPDPFKREEDDDEEP